MARQVRWRFLSDEPFGSIEIWGRPDWIGSTFGGADALQGVERVVQVGERSCLDSLLEELSRRQEIFLDTETWGPRPGDGLDPCSRTSGIILLQLAVSGRCWLLDPELIRWLRPLLESGPCKVMQNAKHDMAFLLAKCGIPVWPAACTMLAEQILQSTGVGLKHLARRYPPHRVLDKRAVELFIHWKGRMDASMVRYAAMDVLCLPDIWAGQKQRLASAGLLGIAALEFENLPVAVEMTLRGVWLDVERHQRMLAFHEARLQQLEQKVLEEYRRSRIRVEEGLFGPIERAWNLRAPEDKKQMLADCGVEVKTSSAEDLEMCGHPLAQAMVEFMAAAKIVDTYGMRLRRRVHPDTGRIHPKFDQLGAGERAEEQGRSRSETISTGRWSSDFQQLPRPEYFYEPVDEETERRVRAAFPELG